MLVKNVPIKDLVKAGYNPKGRVSAGSHMAQLVKSIENVGLIYPVAVTKDLKLIDGHRRLAAAQQLGWDSIPALFVSVENPELAYAEVNANSRYLTGNDNLTVWLKRPGAVTLRAARRFENAENLLGRKLLVRMALAGFSVGIISAAVKISGYVDHGDDKRFIANVVRWLVKHRNQMTVRAYIVMQNPPATLHKAIESGKDLRVNFTAD